MKQTMALIAGVVVALSAVGEARAQAASNAPFDPFATFSLSRFTFNTLGFLQVGPTSPFALPGGGTTAAPVSGDDDELPQAVVTRPPYRPPVRSAYRPPPRPPF